MCLYECMYVSVHVCSHVHVRVFVYACGPGVGVEGEGGVSLLYATVRWVL